MLDYSELTVYTNKEGIATALGYPIHSFMLQNNKPLFGGGKTEVDAKHLAVPAGLVCVTKTTCMNANAMANANAMDANAMDANAMDANADEIVPDGLYERLMELAETRESKKMTKRKKLVKKNKTHKTKKLSV
jgi:hypothetical protein